MTALTASHQPPEIKGYLANFPVAAGVKIFSGALVVLNSSGYAQPGTAAAGLIAVGVATDYVDNTDGDAGDLRVEVRLGIFGFAASGIAETDYGKLAYIVDDQTVSLSSNSGARSIAGRICGVEGKVFVMIGADALPGASQGKRLVTVPVRVVTLVGTNTYGAPSPVTGNVLSVYSRLGGALATGDATLTPKIGSTEITTTPTPLTITQSGSAAGDVDSVTATAANTVVAGDSLNVTVGGTNTNAVEAAVIFLVEVA